MNTGRASQLKKFFLLLILFINSAYTMEIKFENGNLTITNSSNLEGEEQEAEEVNGPYLIPTFSEEIILPKENLASAVERFILDPESREKLHSATWPNAEVFNFVTKLGNLTDMIAQNNKSIVVATNMKSVKKAAVAFANGEQENGENEENGENKGEYTGVSLLVSVTSTPRDNDEENQITKEFKNLDLDFLASPLTKEDIEANIKYVPLKNLLLTFSKLKIKKISNNNNNLPLNGPLAVFGVFTKGAQEVNNTINWGIFVKYRMQVAKTFARDDSNFFEEGLGNGLTQAFSVIGSLFQGFEDGANEAETNNATTDGNGENFQGCVHQ